MAAYYISSTSNTAVGGASESIAPTGLASGMIIEVTCTTAAGAWVNHQAGAATVGGANCSYIPPGGFLVLVATSATLNAIRESATDASMTVSILGGNP